MGAVGVRLGEALEAPLRGRCWSSRCRLGGNVYLPRVWAFGFTQGEHGALLSATPFDIVPAEAAETGGRYGQMRAPGGKPSIDASGIMHNERVS